MTCSFIEPRRAAWRALLCAGLCGCAGLYGCARGDVCREYPTWIGYVVFGADDTFVEVAGLAGDDVIACDADPGGEGFVARYQDGELDLSTSRVAAEFVKGYGWHYEAPPLPEDSRWSLLGAGGPFRIDVQDPDSPVTVHIESVFNPEHDLAISFVDADGSVLAETLVE